ncbi:MAG: hypothetical protein AAF688_11725 [Bacteroidota bacterium]
MRSLSILVILSIFLSCDVEKKKTNTDNSNNYDIDSYEEEVLTTAEKIAQAHGISQWENVNEISFTFNVDANGGHSERSWIWKPKTSDVSMISAKDTIIFNRKSIDSLSLGADRAFINDKFWLLAPFQLVWDTGTEISDPIKSIAPISGREMNKITLTYVGEGGYTPGDAYDFFYSDDFKIKEWIFRKGNAMEPSLSTSFENYEAFNGIEIAKDHKQKDVDWNLYFSNITVK